MIQQALDRLMQGRTTLILAHRLSSVIGADRILVLDDGRVVESGRHAELIARDGPYRRLMGAQAETRPTIRSRDASEFAAGDAARPSARSGRGGAEPPRRASAAQVGWRATLRTLLALHRPWRGQLRRRLLAASARVAAFIGVGVLGALVVARVKPARPFRDLLIVSLLLVAPLAGMLHWLESWLAHDMAYRLLAEMRIELFAKLDALAPAYLAAAALRRSGGARDPGRRDGRVFLRPYRGAGVRRRAGAGRGAGVTLASVAWPLALALLPFLPVRGAGAGACARRRIDGSAARRATRWASSAPMSQRRSRAWPNWSRSGGRRGGAPASCARCGLSGGSRLQLLADLARQTARLEIATGLGGLAVAVVGAELVAERPARAHRCCRC